jgi:hypothetical protein
MGEIMLQGQMLSMCLEMFEDYALIFNFFIFSTDFSRVFKMLVVFNQFIHNKMFKINKLSSMF